MRRIARRTDVDFLTYILNFRTRLKGYKSYLVAITGLAIGLQVVFFGGDASAPTFAEPIVQGLSSGDGVKLILESLGLGTLRAGVAKVNGR
jgi:hypothetical protein